MKELSVRRMIGLVILLGTAGICLLIGKTVQKAICNNVYILSFSQGDKNFPGSDITIAEKEGISLTYVKYLYPEISNGFRIETARVIATNDNYSYFTDMEIRAGSFFNHIQRDKKRKVAVLNEVVAYQLFGNYNCIGEKIYLDQNTFQVVGIVKERGNENEPKIYIPDKTVEALGMPCSEVKQLWCGFSNMAEASMIINKMGYSMNEIDMIQMDLYKGVFMQRFFVLLLIAGMVPLVRIFKMAFHKAKECKGAIGENRNWMIKWILQIVICGGGFTLMLKLIQLLWLVPPNYDVVEKSWVNIFYEILEFYTMSGIKMDNMQFLYRWNLLSLFCLVIGIISIIFQGKNGRMWLLSLEP